MSYAQLSLTDSIKLHIYDIFIGNHHWYATSNAQTINYNAILFSPQSGLSHSELPNWLQQDDAVCTIKLPFDHEISQVLKQSTPGGNCGVKILEGHAGDTDFIEIWHGYMSDYAIELPYALIGTQSYYSRSKRSSLNAVLSTSCGVGVYTPACGLNKDNFKALGTVDAVSGTTVTSQSFLTVINGHLVGGYAEWAHPDFADIKMQARIVYHNNDTIKISTPNPSLQAGVLITAYEGCSGELERCMQFNNVVNFRGAPYINGRNPFDGNRIF